MRQKTGAFWLFLFFAASAAAAADEAAAAVEATTMDAAETASGFRESNPRFCDRRQVGHTHPLHAWSVFVPTPLFFAQIYHI